MIFVSPTWPARWFGRFWSSLEPQAVRYFSAAEFEGWSRCAQAVQAILLAHGARDVLEIGCGATPTLSLETAARAAVKYTISDSSAEELAKADERFQRVVLDATAHELPTGHEGAYDLVFSRMVAEHVPDGERFHRNVLRLLRPGGIAVHWFAALGALPFLANRFLPEFVSAPLLRRFAPRDAERHGKFPARYSWCQGPTPRRLQAYADVGFEVLEYHGYFGHKYYKRRLPWLHRLEIAKTELLLRKPRPGLSSYARVVLRKA